VAYINAAICVRSDHFDLIRGFGEPALENFDIVVETSKFSLPTDNATGTPPAHEPLLELDHAGLARREPRLENLPRRRALRPANGTGNASLPPAEKGGVQNATTRLR